MGYPPEGIIGLLAFDLGGGFKWQRNGLGQACGGASGVFVNNPQDGAVTSYDPGGDVRWHVALVDLPGTSPSPPGLGPDETFYVPHSGRPWFNAIDVEGNVRWSILPEHTAAWPVVRDDNAMVVTGGYARVYAENVVQAFDPATGDLLWRVELPFADASWAVAQQWYGEFSRNGAPCTSRPRARRRVRRSRSCTRSTRRCSRPT